MPCACLRIWCLPMPAGCLTLNRKSCWWPTVRNRREKRFDPDAQEFFQRGCFSRFHGCLAGFRAGNCQITQLSLTTSGPTSVGIRPSLFSTGSWHPGSTPTFCIYQLAREQMTGHPFALIGLYEHAVVAILFSGRNASLVDPGCGGSIVLVIQCFSRKVILCKMGQFRSLGVRHFYYPRQWNGGDYRESSNQCSTASAINSFVNRCFSSSLAGPACSKTSSAR